MPKCQLLLEEQLNNIIKIIKTKIVDYRQINIKS